MHIPNSSYITSNICILAIFVTVDLQAIFHITHIAWQQIAEVMWFPQ
jgi:hypothetical protein